MQIVWSLVQSYTLYRTMIVNAISFTPFSFNCSYTLQLFVYSSIVRILFNCSYTYWKITVIKNSSMGNFNFFKQVLVRWFCSHIDFDSPRKWKGKTWLTLFSTTLAPVIYGRKLLFKQRNKETRLNYSGNFCWKQKYVWIYIRL